LHSSAKGQRLDPFLASADIQSFGEIAYGLPGVFVFSEKVPSRSVAVSNLATGHSGNAIMCSLAAFPVLDALSNRP